MIRGATRISSSTTDAAPAGPRPPLVSIKKHFLFPLRGTGAYFFRKEKVAKSYSRELRPLENLRNLVFIYATTHLV